MNGFWVHFGQGGQVNVWDVVGLRLAVENVGLGVCLVVGRTVGVGHVGGGGQVHAEIDDGQLNFQLS